MKHLMSLGLAAIAALGLLALVGPGTASATTLSTDSAGTIKYASGTTLHLTLESGTSSTITDTSGNTIATCTGSTIHGSIGIASGSSVTGEIDTLTWEGCSQTTDTIFPGGFFLSTVGGDTGEFDGSGSDVTLSIFGISCTYGTFGTLGTITGGESPTLRITNTFPKKAGGFLCPSTAIWHAAYILTSPHAVHFVS